MFLASSRSLSLRKQTDAPKKSREETRAQPTPIQARKYDQSYTVTDSDTKSCKEIALSLLFCICMLEPIVFMDTSAGSLSALSAHEYFGRLSAL